DFWLTDIDWRSYGSGKAASFKECFYGNERRPYSLWLICRILFNGDRGLHLAVSQKNKTMYVGKNIEDWHCFVSYFISVVSNSCEKSTQTRSAGYECCLAMDLWFFCAYIFVLYRSYSEIAGACYK